MRRRSAQAQRFASEGPTSPQTAAQLVGVFDKSHSCSETLRGHERRARLVVQLVRLITRVESNCPQAVTRLALANGVDRAAAASPFE